MVSPKTVSPKTHFTEHRTTVDAPADAVYALIADVTQWPWMFTPTVHAEQLETDGDVERIRLWALANGEVRTWTSCREHDPEARRVSFRQEVSQAPVASMGGAWSVHPVSEYACEVVLTHDYAAVDDDPAGVDWIARACDRNSRAELADLKAAAEGEAVGGTVLTFTDALLTGADAKSLHDFVDRADLWTERLPHVARVSLTEDPPRVQRLAMDTRAPDGSVHTTESIRICLPDLRIVYKQTRLPGLLAAHTGEWRFEAVGEEAVRLSSRHTAVIDPDAVASVLGPDATVADARAHVRRALSGNSLATLRLARAHAEESAGQRHD